MTQEQVFNPDEMLAVLGITDQQQYSDNNGEIRNTATGRIIEGGDGSDASLNVEFALEPVLHKLETFRKGSNVYIDMEFVTIHAPGDRLTLIHRPVTEHDKWRFPVDYANFKKGQSAVLTGTPLALWPLVSPSQAKELQSLGIRTVEQVAALPDTNAPQFRGFYGLKVKAQQFLEQASDSAAATRLQAELDQRDASHKTEMAAVREQMNELIQLVQASSKVSVPEEAAATDEPIKMRFGKPIKG